MASPYGVLGAAGGARGFVDATTMANQILSQQQARQYAQQRMQQEQQAFPLQQAKGFLDIGLPDRAATEVGAQPGSVADPFVRQIAGKMAMQQFERPKTVQEALIGHFMPQQVPQGPVGAEMGRTYGLGASTRTAGPGPTGLGTERTAPDMMAQGPTGPMTQMPQGGQTNIQGLLDAVLGMEKQDPIKRVQEAYIQGKLDPSSPLYEIAENSLQGEKAPKDIYERTLRKFAAGEEMTPQEERIVDAAIAGKTGAARADITEARIKLLEATQANIEKKMDLERQKLDLEKMKFGGVELPKAGAAVTSAEAAKKQADVAHQRISEDRRKNFEGALREIQEQHVQQAPNAWNVSMQNQLAASTREKIRGLFNRYSREIPDDEAGRAEKQRMQVEMLEAMAPYKQQVAPGAKPRFLD